MLEAITRTFVSLLLYVC